MSSLQHNWITNIHEEIRARLNKMGYYVPNNWADEITFLKGNLSLAPIRLLQTLSVLFNLHCILFGYSLIPFLLIYMIVYTKFWYLAIIYLVWIFIDRKTAFKGGRKLYFLRNLKIFEYFRDFFPVKLIKTAELSADKNYLFVMYPHGLLGYSVLANFGSNANNFDNLYPGLDTRQITLDSNFYVPFSREYFLSLGGCAASESSLLYLLGGAPSKAVILVAGGAQESLLSHPGTYKIILNRRKGFVRIALKTGASLVPVFSFGENDVHYQYRSPWWSKIQDAILKTTRVVPIVPEIKSLIPYRTPINTIVGSPIHCPKVENVTQELIDKYHEIYKTELIKLFETYKGQYDTKNGKNAELEIF